MRCDEVIRELAAPTADRDRGELSDHLAGCPACAEWARRAESLDRLWEATRPVEPSPEVWDAIWANIAQALPSTALARHEDGPAVGAAPSCNGSGPKVVIHSGPAPAPAVAPIPAVLPPRRGRGWRFAAVALVGLAQAAAILIALGLAWQTQTPPRSGRPTEAPDLAEKAPAAIRSASPVEIQAEFEASCLMVIHVDQKSSRIEDRTPPEMNVSADIGMEVTNVMESIATPQVAALEVR